MTEAVGMVQEWERQAVIDELTERIDRGEFVGGYEALKAILEGSDALTERDRQRVMQFWVSKEREIGRN